MTTGLGSLAIDIYTGGWEWKYANLSLFDFGHAEIGAEFKNNQLNISALASAWSPSFSFSIFGIEFEIGAEVGSVGADINVGLNGFSVAGSLGLGLSLSIKW